MKKYFWFGWKDKTCDGGIKEVNSEEEFQEWMTNRAMELCEEYGAHSINCTYSDVGEPE